MKRRVEIVRSQPTSALLRRERELAESTLLRRLGFTVNPFHSQEMESSNPGRGSPCSPLNLCVTDMPNDRDSPLIDPGENDDRRVSTITSALSQTSLETATTTDNLEVVVPSVTAQGSYQQNIIAELQLRSGSFNHHAQAGPSQPTPDFSRYLAGPPQMSLARPLLTPGQFYSLISRSPALLCDLGPERVSTFRYFNPEIPFPQLLANIILISPFLPLLL